MNQTDLDLVVVGSVSKSLESYIASGKYPRLKVMGMVDDLSPFYQNASCVVSPIFLGSGLKTKTIEALMFGKTFLGTDEAFQGVSCDYDTIGGLRIEARQKLKNIQPHSIGQASRISGVSPADIAVLVVYLKQLKGNGEK